MSCEVGQFVSDYEILGVLGKGGMGAVYRVRNVISNRVEAMKVLLADLGAQAELGDRFISEIRTLARLDHPNIAKFHTAFKTENQLVMVMEFVEGFTFSDVLRQGAIPTEQTLSYVSQTLSALACAHDNGVVHRDIKPSNIMVTPHGVVKLMDFGIAKSSVDPNLTRPGTTMGSMLYMSPEQVRGINVDARSDLYSLGIVLYELTAGKRPFEAENTFAILDAHLNAPARPPIELNPQVPQALNEIILIAIEKDPMRRFQSATAFRAALENVRQRPGVAASQPANAGLERNLAATIPAPAGRAAFPQNSQPLVEPGFAIGAAGGQQSFGSNPQPNSMGTPGSNVPSGLPAKKANRALWMAAGAIACICVLGAAIYTLPSLLRSPSASSRTEALHGNTPVVNRDKSPAASPTSDTRGNGDAAIANPPAKPETAVGDTSANSALKGSSMRAAQKSGAVSLHGQAESVGAQAVPQQVPQPSTPVLPPSQQVVQQPTQPVVSQEEIEKASEELMKLRSRAEAIKGSLNNLRSQQASQGVGLRPDIAGSASRMDSYLQAADGALQSGRIDFAHKSMDHADQEITKIETFFGR